MVKTKAETIVAIAVAAALLIIWDFKVASNAVAGDTISELMLEYARGHAWLPLAWGILTGHLFLPLYGPRPRLLRGWRGLGASAAVVAAVAWWGPQVPPLAALAAGVPLGRLLWGQEPPAATGGGSA